MDTTSWQFEKPDDDILANLNFDAAANQGVGDIEEEERAEDEDRNDWEDCFM